NLFRVDTIRDELGGEVAVTYGQPNGCIRNNWATNASNCCPGWWSPKQGTAGFVAWNKYLVTEVVQGALSSASTFTNSVYVGEPITTRYSYVGDPAWHYDDRPGVSKRVQSWGDWRGYETVRTSTGNSTPTVTETRYFRGMNGDRANASGGVRSVSVTASGGITAEAPVFTAVDDPAPSCGGRRARS
ncbi:MAG TPA: hypothetical protein PLV68_15910, partial [Ilumatobacteraceae bacterium]|nr:hypothetical protein [Ilumatobacteraceae bacterium]